jgi:hypothetical protein
MRFLQLHYNGIKITLQLHYNYITVTLRGEEISPPQANERPSRAAVLFQCKWRFENKTATRLPFRNHSEMKVLS